MIELPNLQPEVQRKRLSFVTRLQQRLGDQRINLLIVQPNTPKQAIHACASHGDSLVNTTQMSDRARFLATLYIVAKESAHLEWSRQRLFSQLITPAWIDGLDTQPEPAERPGSQIQVLNRAEQLGVLEDASQWLEARQLRNSLIHEYMENSTAFAENIQLAEHYSHLLLETCQRVHNDAATRLGSAPHELR